MTAVPHVGEHRTIEHTFSIEEVRAFAEASGDRGEQHVTPDEQGRLMVHGLLVGTLPTTIGGQLSFLAREMTFEFIRPVFTGERIRCDVLLTKWEASGKTIRVAAEWTCVNQEQTTVMRGHASGIVRAPPPTG